MTTIPLEEMHDLKVGPGFLFDYLDRLYDEVDADGVVFWQHVDQPDSKLRIVRKTKSYWFVELTLDAVTDLYGDADYYASFRGYDFADNRSLSLAARAVLKQLAAQFEFGH